MKGYVQFRVARSNRGSLYAIDHQLTFLSRHLCHWEWYSL